MYKCTHHESNPKLRIPTSKAPFLKQKQPCDGETSRGAIATYKLVPESAPSFTHREEVLAKGAVDGRPRSGRGEGEEGREERGNVVDKGEAEVASSCCGPATEDLDQ
jgi:hypothetical protein